MSGFMLVLVFIIAVLVIGSYAKQGISYLYREMVVKKRTEKENN